MTAPVSVAAPALATALALAGLALIAWPAAVVARSDHRRTALLSSDNRRAVLLGFAITAAVLVLAPGLWSLAAVAGAAAALVARRGPVRRGPAADELEMLAMVCDLLAACLDAGMAVATSIQAVTSVLRRSGAARPTGRSPTRDGDPVEILTSIAAMLELGADPDVAWRSAVPVPALAPVASAARRSARGGTPLADAVRQHALDLRGQVDALAARAVGRAGVAMTAPLAVCFLPGFVCLGLAPVVIGLLGSLDIL